MYSYQVIISSATFAIILLNSVTHAQFWKMKDLSDTEIFIMETKAAMASGICYKEVPSTFNDPTLKFKTLSHCCDGYMRRTDSTSIKCDPVCSTACTNGICSAPNICECYPGYVKRNGQCVSYYDRE